MHMKNWNLIQNAADLAVVYQCEEYACMLHIIFLRALFSQNVGMKYVTYWHQYSTCCEELVPIFHGVKFAKCEICGSTRL